MEIRKARSDHEVTAGLKLVLGALNGIPVEKLDRQQELVRHLAKASGIRLDDQFVMLEGADVVGALLYLAMPDGTAAFSGPAFVRGKWRSRLAHDLLDVALTTLASEGFRMVQALFKKGAPSSGPAERAPATDDGKGPFVPVLDVTSYGALGFRNLADFLFCARPLASGDAATAVPGDYGWVTWAEAGRERFADVVRQTYQGTLDCPEITGKRDAALTIAAHRESGVFHPELWFLALLGEEPVGVLLLNFIPHQSSYEIVYLGVVPQMRGKGVGDVLTAKAVREAAARGDARAITLAVDAANWPARQLYERWGFKVTETQVGMFCNLQSEVARRAGLDDG